MTFESAAMPLVGDLYRAAFRMVHDPAVAERCVERAVLEAGRRFHHSPDVAGIRLRLFAALFYEIHNRRNTWGYVRQWFGGERPDPDEILRELDRLPPALREVVLLSDVEEFNNRERAEILGISEELANARLAEARARLLAALQEPAAVAV